MSNKLKLSPYIELVSCSPEMIVNEFIGIILITYFQALQTITPPLIASKILYKLKRF
jgi:hypothetical protein